jgi:hypothetical protein
VVALLGFAGPVLKIQYLSGELELIGIDGSCLHSISESDLREELGVSSKIMIKKIMACTQ